MRKMRQREAVRMCSGYYLESSKAMEKVAYAARHHALMTKASGKIAKPVITRGEVHPSDIAPVLAPDPKGGVGRVYPMMWGFTTKTGSMVSTVDIDILDDTRDPLLLEAWGRHRCLIPSSWYFEWERLHPAISYDSFGDQTPEAERREKYSRNAARAVDNGIHLTTDSVRHTGYTELTGHVGNAGSTGHAGHAGHDSLGNDGGDDRYRYGSKGIARAINARKRMADGTNWFGMDEEGHNPILTGDSESAVGDRYMLQTKGSSITLLAGLYRIEEYEDIKFPHFIILTRYAAPNIMFIHNKMPVIFDSSDADLLKDWLNPKAVPVWDVDRIYDKAITDVVYDKSPVMRRKSPHPFYGG